MTSPSWMDAALPPGERADLVLREMTREEKLQLVNGHIGPLDPSRANPPEGSFGSAGHVHGIERLCIPAQMETDASLGVANLHDGQGATALPSGLALAASWDEALAQQAGAMIGAETWAKGFNVLLGGGCNLTREPRCGRNFEYLGEDPLLAGVMAGAGIRGVQSNPVVCTIKHFVLNAQETGRMTLSAEIDEAALRESDLLAFQIGIERGAPGAVMTAYNRIGQVYAGEHDFLLNSVLKGDWGFDGYTMSDWGGCHSAETAAMAGLDQESGQELDREAYFQRLGEAIDAGRMPAARLDDMCRRILTAFFKVGAFDRPPAPSTGIDIAAHLEVAQRAAEAGIVLLKNDGLLPLAPGCGSIAVIGAHAGVGVLSGGGSSSVVPWGGFAREQRPVGDSRWAAFLSKRWHPSVPVAAIAAALSPQKIEVNDGADLAAAARCAAGCEFAIVFAEQWASEFVDAPDLALPDGQDALIAAVAAANPNTIVVLETGGPVLMPWLASVRAVVEAWYPGARGAEAIAAVLSGAVNPSGRLPITFPRDLGDTPSPALPGAEVPRGRFDVHYREGSDVGYRWCARERRASLFPFGFGLSYTQFSYGRLHVEGGATIAASCEVTNTGARAGADVVQFYLVEAAGRPVLRLIGWEKLQLAPGETKRASIAADPRLLAHYEPAARGWRIEGGSYRVAVGVSAEALRLEGATGLAPMFLRP